MAPSYVYSVQLVAEQGLDGDYTIVVPAGYVIVVRDIDVYYGGSLTGGHVRFIGSSGQTIWTVASGAPAGWSVWQWRGRQVFDAGQLLTFQTDDAMDVTASGYLLTGSSASTAAGELVGHVADHPPKPPLRAAQPPGPSEFSGAA